MLMRLLILLRRVRHRTRIVVLRSWRNDLIQSSLLIRSCKSFDLIIENLLKNSHIRTYPCESKMNMTTLQCIPRIESLVIDQTAQFHFDASQLRLCFVKNALLNDFEGLHDDHWSFFQHLLLIAIRVSTQRKSRQSPISFQKELSHTEKLNVSFHGGSLSFAPL